MCSVDETKSFSSNADLARQVAAGRVHLQSLREHSASHFVRCVRMTSGTLHTQVRPLQVRRGSIASLVGRMACGGSIQTISSTPLPGELEFPWHGQSSSGSAGSALHATASTFAEDWQQQAKRRRTVDADRVADVVLVPNGRFP